MNPAWYGQSLSLECGVRLTFATSTVCVMGPPDVDEALFVELAVAEAEVMVEAVEAGADSS